MKLNYNLPELKGGTEKQIAWAGKIRQEFIDTINRHVAEFGRRDPENYVPDDEDFAYMMGMEDMEFDGLGGAIKRKLEKVNNAKWYIENRGILSHGLWVKELKKNEQR